MPFSSRIPVPVARRDARRLLATVLQRVEPHVGEVRGLGVAEDAEEAALVVEVVVLEGQAAERRRPGLRSAHAPDVSIPLEAFMTPDLSFPDLRSFLEPAPARRRPRRRGGGGGSPPRGRRDPPPRHRRRRPRAAVHAGPRGGPAARHQPLRHRPPGPARLRHAAGAARQAARPPRRDPDAPDGRQAVGRAGRRPGGAAHRPREARERAGHGGRDRRRAPRPPARAHLLARGRRPLRHAAARLHGAPRRAGPLQPRHVPAPASTTRGRPACTGRSARAAASTTPWRRPEGRTCR